MSETAADCTEQFNKDTATIRRWLAGQTVDLPTLVAELQRWAHDLTPADAPCPIRNALDDDEAEAVLEAGMDRALGAAVAAGGDGQVYFPTFVAALADLGVVLTWEKPQDRIEFLTREDEA